MISAGNIEAVLNLNAQPFVSGLASAREQLSTFTDNTQTAGTRISALGGVATAIGSTLTKSVTVPLLGIGAGAVKVAVDFEAEMSRVKAISGATGSDFEKLQAQAEELGAATSFSATEAASGMENLASAGFTVNQIMDAMPGLLDLAASDNLDLATAADIAASTLNGFGLEASQAAHVADVLAKAAADTNAGITDTGEAMKYIAPVAATMGQSLEEVTAAIGIMSNAGIKGGQAGTTLRTALTRLANPSEKAAELMEALGFNAYDSSGKMLSLKDIVGNLENSLAGLTEEQQQQAIATIFGQESMSGMLSLIAAGPAELEKLTKSLKNADGAASDMADTMMDNTKGAWDEFTSALEGAGIAISNFLLPTLTKLLKGVTNVVSSFTTLDKGTQKLIVNAGLVVAATGPLLTVGGKIVKGIGSVMSLVNNLIPAIGGTGLTGMLSGLSVVALPLTATIAALGTGFYAWHEAIEVGNQSVAVAREEMSFMERAMADLTGMTTYSKDELVEMGLIYEDFNENISQEFQDTVKEMTLDIQDFGMTLNDINFDGVISDEEVNTLSTRVSKALENCTIAIDEKYSDIQSGIKEAFSMDGVIDETETSLIEYWNNRGSKEKEEAQRLQNEINNITNAARAEGRELRPEEVEAIENYYAQIKQIELECQASNQYEIEYATQEFQNRVATLDEEGAMELLSKRYEQYAEQQLATQTNYDTLINLAKQNYENLSAEEQAQVNATIERLEAAKAEELRINEEKYNSSVDYALKENEALSEIYNRYTGERIARRDLDNYNEYEAMRQHYEGITSITESGYRRIYDTATGTMKDVYVSIDETTGMLKGVYDLNTQNVAAMSKEDESALRDELAAWQQTETGVLANCITMGEAYLDFKGNISNASGEIIGKLTQVEDENGNLVDAIVDVNNNPLVIGENTAEVIKKLQDTQNEVDKTNGKKAKINVTDDGTVSSVQTKINNIKGKTVTVSAIMQGSAGQHTTGGTWTYATGTSNAMPGLATVAEYGAELIKSRNGNLSLATSRQLVNLEGGERIYNARETNEILKDMEGNNNDNKGFILLAEKIETLTKVTDSLKANMDNIATKIEEKELTGDIILDDEKVGEAIYPTVSNRLAIERSSAR